MTEPVRPPPSSLPMPGPEGESPSGSPTAPSEDRPPAASAPSPDGGGRPGASIRYYGQLRLASVVRYGRADPTRYTYGDKPAHVIDWEERAFKRNTIAGALAVAAGVCFLLGGVSGAGTWRELGDWVAPSAGGLRETVVQLFLVVASVATLGGLLVMGGGALLLLQRLFLGRLLVFIGGGTGLSGLALSLGLPLWEGALWEFGRGLAALVSLSGAGTALAIASGFLIMLPFSLRKLLFGKG